MKPNFLRGRPHGHQGERNEGQLRWARAREVDIRFLSPFCHVYKHAVFDDSAPVLTKLTGEVCARSENVKKRCGKNSLKALFGCAELWTHYTNSKLSVGVGINYPQASATKKQTLWRSRLHAARETPFKKSSVALPRMTRLGAKQGSREINEQSVTALPTVTGIRIPRTSTQIFTAHRAHIQHHDKPKPRER